MSAAGPVWKWASGVGRGRKEMWVGRVGVRQGRTGRDTHDTAQGTPCKILEIRRGYGERSGHPVLFLEF